MTQTFLILACLSCVAWLYLVFLHGGFWRAACRIGTDPVDALTNWPDVVVVIPARNEADVIGRTVNSLLMQDYPHPVPVLLVNDNSNDGTVTAERQAATAIKQQDRLCIHDGAALPAGWTGKVWAMHQGVSRAQDLFPRARYILFSDADILHEPSNLRRLVARAETEGRDLVSIMVLLAAKGVWERLLIPPFVFFFQMLYPFAWVNDDSRKSVAAAAGGCMLVRRAALERAGGMSVIRDALIDDCRLARLPVQPTLWRAARRLAHGGPKRLHATELFAMGAGRLRDRHAAGLCCSASGPGGVNLVRVCVGSSGAGRVWLDVHGLSSDIKVL